MTLVIFQGRLGWYWRLIAKNNKIRAIGAEPFASKRSALRSFNDTHAELSTSFEPRAPHKRVRIAGGLVPVRYEERKRRVR